MGTNSEGTAADDLFRAKLFRDFSGTMLWQVLGKLFQVVGMVYATRCLGPDNIGVSRTIITLAMTLQLCLAFGLDAVAVRHVAKGLAKAGEIAPAIFTFRFALGLLAAIPAVIAYNKLSKDLDRYASRLDTFAGEFSAILSRQMEDRD